MFEKATRWIIGAPLQFGIDARILHTICFVMGVTGVIATLVSLWPLHSPATLIYPCLIGSLIGFLAWYLGRFHNLFFCSFLLLLFTQLIAMSFVFMYHDGVRGPAAFFFTTWIPVYIFILRAPLATLAVLAFFTLFTVLYFLQINHIIAPIDYSNDGMRAADVYAGFAFHFILTATIATCAKIIFETTQKKIQASNQAKTQFLANISHEIRTPMNAIIGMNELALSHSTDEQQQNWLKNSRIAAQHLLGLMEDLLDISSIDEGKLTITCQTIALHETVNEVVNLLRNSATQKNIFVEVLFADDLPSQLEADPVRLRQVLVNLLNNAIKFTHQGAIRLMVSVRESSQGKVTLLFALHDSGIGIHQDQQQQIFDIFTQGRNIDVFRHKGFGLGLAISKQLVEKMGGNIWLESQPNRGSTFFFTLPARVVKAPDNQSVPSPVTVDTDTKQNHHLLLVEDNAINADVIRFILQKKGFTLDVASNGNVALGKLAKRKYAVILMDLEMPVMDGFETTKALLAGSAGSLNQHTPILAITAHALDAYRKKCFAAGMQGFITKPVSGELMTTEIKRLIASTGN